MALVAKELSDDHARNAFKLLTCNKSRVCLNQELGSRLRKVSQRFFNQRERTSRLVKDA